MQYLYKNFKKAIITEKLENFLDNIYDPIPVKLLSRLRLIFTHLNKHKFRHGKSYMSILCDTVNPMCPSRTDLKIKYQR